MEERCVGRKHYNRTRWVRFQLLDIELLAYSAIENARYHCVDSILRMLVRHQLHAMWHFDPDHIHAGLIRLADEDSKSDWSWESGERLPIDVFCENRFQKSFAGSGRPIDVFSCFTGDCCSPM